MPETFALTRTCAECPWRKDVPTGRFPPERYRGLRLTCEQGMNRYFACHKSPEGDEFTCVGYLLVDGENNFRVRIARSRGWYDPEKLRADGPLYENFAEMARANGYDPDADDDHYNPLEYNHHRRPTREEVLAFLQKLDDED